MGSVTVHTESGSIEASHSPETGSSPGRLSFREFLVAFFVILHFTLGLLATVPKRSVIWDLPVFHEVGTFYRNNRLDQSWAMFSPPPRINEFLQYSVQLPGGWTQLVTLSSFASDQVKRRLVQPRGMFRLLSFFRVISEDKTPGGMTQTSLRAFYYQQLSDYFCKGDGKIPEMLRIRFYLIGKGIPDFFDKDEYGQPTPPGSAFDYRQPLYEQKCLSR